jgi:hypothetical protein
LERPGANGPVEAVSGPSRSTTAAAGGDSDRAVQPALLLSPYCSALKRHAARWRDGQAAIVWHRRRDAGPEPRRHPPSSGRRLRLPGVEALVVVLSKPELDRSDDQRDAENDHAGTRSSLRVLLPLLAFRLAPAL